MPQAEFFDLLVVGAGTGGCVAAKVGAEKGLSVGLVDRKPFGTIGEKVCGDGIGKHHFDLLGMSPPAGEELATNILGIDVYSPDQKTVFRVEGEGLQGFIINRRVFGQRLLKEALDRGAYLRDNLHVFAPIIEGGCVRGVKGRIPEREEAIEIRAKVTVDASGCTAILRKSLPKELGMETDIQSSDVIVCYREIREIQGAIERPEFCRIFLSQKAAPGGYYWIFPKSPNVVNVGLGVQMKEGFENPRDLLYSKVLTKDLFKGSTLIHGGGGIVPTRRPLSTLVSSGFMVVGDSACQVNPIHGGGIGPSMVAGKLAAEAAADAITKGSTNAEDLWQYNLRYMKTYGARQAQLEIFRIFLQKLDDSDIDFGMSQRIISEADLLRLSHAGELRLSIPEKSRRLAAGIRKLSLLRRLRYTQRRMREVRALYMNYPSREGLITWASAVEDIVRGVALKV
jgi:geranylgeranyl reductase family protein